jgi:hypothetical protein
MRTSVAGYSAASAAASQGWTCFESQDVDLAGAHDSTILAWAAGEGCVLLTHDASTLPVHAYDRVARGLPMPGVFVISQSAPPTPMIEELLTLAQCSREGEWEGQVVYLPL